MGILGAKTGRMTSNLPEKIGSENLQFRSSCFFLVLFRASSCFRRAFSCKRNCRAKFSREKPEENRKVRLSSPPSMTEFFRSTMMTSFSSSPHNKSTTYVDTCFLSSLTLYLELRHPNHPNLNDGRYSTSSI